MKLKIKEQKINQVFHPIQIKDRTKLTLKNGIIVPTSLAMERMLNK